MLITFLIKNQHNLNFYLNSSYNYTFYKYSIFDL